MMTREALAGRIGGYAFVEMEGHAHTYLCDGARDMTVERIAQVARARGIRLVILAPHGHRALRDGERTHYWDTDEAIFETLRADIDRYARLHETPQFLLTSEMDILDVSGETSLAISPAMARCLDFLLPTVNFHPLLGIQSVEGTSFRTIRAHHDSGQYARLAQAAGGQARVLTGYFEAYQNALQRSDLPCVPGHLLLALSEYAPGYTWFGVTPEDMPLIYALAESLLETIAANCPFVDLTGLFHTAAQPDWEGKGPAPHLLAYARWWHARLRGRGIPTVCGSDAHSLDRIGYAASFYEKIL